MREFTWPLLFLLVGLLATFNLTRSFAAPADIASSVSPRVQLRADRRVSLLGLITMSAALGICWLLVGGVFAEAVAAVFAFDMLIVLMLGGIDGALSMLNGPGGAWELFLDARTRLVMRGRLPIRVISFLEDARERGVLRQEGGSISSATSGFRSSWSQAIHDRQIMLWRRAG